MFDFRYRSCGRSTCMLAKIMYTTFVQVASVAPAAINRKKKQTNIEKENARLLARLQSVKPDKSLNSKKLAQDHQLHQKVIWFEEFTGCPSCTVDCKDLNLMVFMCVTFMCAEQNTDVWTVCSIDVHGIVVCIAKALMCFGCDFCISSRRIAAR